MVKKLEIFLLFVFDKIWPEKVSADVANRKLTEKTSSAVMYLRDKGRTDLHLFQTRFVVGWESNRNGDITIPLSLKTTGSVDYREQ